jgi:glycosyltransferase involved in cell wall biosynthesis
VTAAARIPEAERILDLRAERAEPPLLTVALCVRDGGDHLADRFADDLFEGWRDDLEFVVVDDGSRDDTLRVVRDLARRLGGTAVLSNPVAHGPGVARAQAVDASRGRYVWFADCDDAFDLAGVVALAEQARDDGFDAVVGRAEVELAGRLLPKLIDAVEPGARDRREWVRMLLHGEVDGYLWNKVLSRDLAADSPDLPLLRTQEDFCRVVLAASRAQRVLFSSRIVYRYRMHDASVTRTRTPELGNLQASRDYLAGIAVRELAGDSGLAVALARFDLRYYALPAVRVPVYVAADPATRRDGRRRARAAMTAASLAGADRRTALVGQVLRHAPGLYASWYAAELALRRHPFVRAVARAVRPGSRPTSQERRIDVDDIAS